MNAAPQPTIVIVPGLRDHVADHWQTHLAADLDVAERYDSVTVPPLERDKLSRHARVAALDRMLHQVDGPVVLVAHSAGVMTTVHWAQNPTREVAGALLVTPADLELRLPEGYPTTQELDDGGWTPIPRRRLPFPTVVAASRTDALGGFRRITGMAEVWGARVIDLGDVGHLNPAAGYGPWPRATQLIDDLLTMTSAHQPA
ncbi:alpha/beta hydrolase [Gordonia sp. LSe1-13]|uniref:Alpha/beta hydrolase n=1 Tax=Gordonia sesuvii TaxID=3116777 RepID=A0ABU7MG23_9ACTN|nr:alpha/beta hydrolase [Gordonia sp. LSe1-13]